MKSSLLLIIGGSIAAYKTLDLIRRLRERGVTLTCVLTQGGEQFVTRLSLSALSGGPVYSELFSLTEESEMGHIRLARDHALIAVIPASADRLARMASGQADDLAGAVLLAAGDTPVLVAPAMNAAMWDHPATKRNLERLQADGVTVIAPAAGALACGEVGQGRLAEESVLLEAILSVLGKSGKKPLEGRKALVTSGPTFEPIDPVRFIGNRSSGKQGHAVAQALHDAGAEVTLVSGPTLEPSPDCARLIRVETADAMLAACMEALPADLFVACAAVSDWRAERALDHKLKKRANASPPEIRLAFNPDILATLARHAQRPQLVIGFAAETEEVEANAREKRNAKSCDWLIANQVGGGRVFGRDDTDAYFLDDKTSEFWHTITKTELARRLTDRIIRHFSGPETQY